MLQTQKMFVRFSCLGLALSLLSFKPVAATSMQSSTASLQEPQYIGQFEQIGPEGKLIPLEQTKLNNETKAKNHIISNSVTSSWTVPSASSTVRVSSTAHFVVKASPSIAGIDPHTLVYLKPFVVAKTERTLPMTASKGVIFGGIKSESAADTSIAISFKPYGTSSLEVTPDQPLSPGEYLFGGPGLSGQVFCFGVDQK
jgi:hypothetical protein